LAAAVGKLSVFKLLLSCGAAIDAVDSRGRRAIHYAASTAQIDVVELILGVEKGSVISQDNDGRNSLHYAARGISCLDGALAGLSDQKKVMSALIREVSDELASVAVGSALGSLATSSQTFCAWSPEARRFFEASILYLSTLTKVTPCPGFLHLAFKSDGFPLDVALAVCTDPNEVDARNRTALHAAATVSRTWDSFHGHLARKLEYVDLRDSDGKTVIQLVLEGPSPCADEVPNRLKILLDAGADINGKSDTGQALVVVAAERLRGEKPLADTNIPRLSDGTLAALLERGAAIEDLDDHMLWKLLETLVRTEREVDLAKMLRALTSEQKALWLKQGIIEVPLPSEMVLAAFGIDWSRETLACLVQHLGDEELDRLRAEILQRRLPVLADICRFSRIGVPLHPKSVCFRKLRGCARAGNMDSLAFFIDSMGGDVDTRDAFGRTLLALAAESGQVDAVKYLLSRGALHSVTDPEEKSPLYWAAREGKLEVLKVLIEAGANIRIIDIHAALELGTDTVFTYLTKSSRSRGKD
jgi:ankyrin repeat protein